MFDWLFYRFPSPSLSTGISAQQARNTAESTVRPLENRVDHLQLACAALWMILKKHHGYTDDELIAAIREVDEMDGSADGKIRNPNATCPHCNRKLLTASRDKCSWCGKDLMSSPI